MHPQDTCGSARCRSASMLTCQQPTDRRASVPTTHQRTDTPVHRHNNVPTADAPMHQRAPHALTCPASVKVRRMCQCTHASTRQCNNARNPSACGNAPPMHRYADTPNSTPICQCGAVNATHLPSDGHCEWQCIPPQEPSWPYPVHSHRQIIYCTGTTSGSSSTGPSIVPACFVV